jgi:hypothetical protein
MESLVIVAFGILAGFVIGLSPHRLVYFAPGGA